MLAGIALVGLSMAVMLHVTTDADPIAREDLAFALSVVLFGLLMMVTRRNAVSQVVGFMSLENGLVLAATGAKGMPLVVEICVAFSILIAFIVIGIFFSASVNASTRSTSMRSTVFRESAGERRRLSHGCSWSQRFAAALLAALPAIASAAAQHPCDVS